MATEKEFQTFEEFWPFYLGEHRDPLCRKLHFVGTSLALASLGAAAVTGNPLFALGAPIAGYGFAWYGHFIVERNRPATFTYPLWSLRGDFRMFKLTLQGKLDAEVTRLYGSSRPSADAPLQANS
ncbi:MAG: DUF962 domain-containing protein [Myxococcales bacterium]|nr:DUF962 domain-containing protein [Myxococcales bacterium]